jgi:hypothetical protein
MLVEFFNKNARNTIHVTMIEELPVKEGFFTGRDTPAINLHFTKLSAFSAEGGNKYIEVEISYDDFMKSAQKAAADPENPLNIVQLKQDVKFTMIG